MKHILRCFCILLCVVAMAAFVLPMSASANGAVPSLWYAVYLENLPEGTAYVDLLIPLEESDPHYYAGLSNSSVGFSPEAEIMTYCEDGYRSYTFHYADAKSRITPERFLGESTLCVTFFESDLSAPNAYTHLEDVESRKWIRLAILDADGNILKVSEKCDLRVGFFSYSLNSFSYDGLSNTLEMETSVSAWSVLVFLLMSIVGIIVTCIVERHVAWPFGLGRNYGGTILATNILSQIAMRAASALLYGWVIKSYIVNLILLESVVYAGEYLFYRKKMRDVSQKRVLFYVITANTASLLLGGILNLLLMNR